MDMIYTDAAGHDMGVLKDFKCDLAFGADENNWVIDVTTDNNVCEAGSLVYIEGTEYGGIVDTVKVDSAAETITYEGRTWHGILESKIVSPNAGQDYYTVTGELNTIIGQLLSRHGLTSLFGAYDGSSGASVNNFKVPRYIGVYEALRRILKSKGYKMHCTFAEGRAWLSAVPAVDYSVDNELDSDRYAFKVAKNYHPINHVICLGQGELKNREVVHVYADAAGNIVSSQVLTGINEVAAVYDYSSAESTDDLRQGGIDMIKESREQDTVEWSFDGTDTDYSVGDIVGAKDQQTGIFASAEITKKIVTITDDDVIVAYKVGGK